MISIRNLDGALGAEVAGVDVSKPLPQADIDAIENAWRERLVVVFHDQALNDPQLIAFSKNFGELDPPGPNPYGQPFLKDHPELNVISNVVENGKPIGNLGDGEAVWHADMTYVDVPPKAAMLHALEVPPPEAGGNTYFANMFAAYEALPADLKQAADGKIAIHDASRNSAGMLRKGYQEVTDVRQTVGARHPLVRTDAEDRPQGAVPRPASERLCAGLERRRQRRLARRTVGARDAAALRHVPRMEGRRPPDVEQSLGAAPARPVRPQDPAGHAPQPDQGQRADRLRAGRLATIMA